MMRLENKTEKTDCPRDNVAGGLSRLCMAEPRPSVLDPFAANSWAVIEICRISGAHESKCNVERAGELPLRLRNRDKQR